MFWPFQQSETRVFSKSYIFEKEKKTDCVGKSFGDSLARSREPQKGQSKSTKLKLLFGSQSV